MTPSEAANDALNATLAAVQPLIKCCMKLKEGDPETLRLLDDIARRMAKDLKTHAGDATSFSPQLLSCTAIIWQYSKGGTFQRVPNWSSVTDNDPQIKDHPRFEKTVDYHPPSELDVPSIATSSTIPTTIPTTTPALIVLPSSGSRTETIFALTSTSESIPHGPGSHRQAGSATKTIFPPMSAQEPAPSRSSGTSTLEIPPPREQWKALFLASDSKKRMVGDEDTDGAVVIEAPKLPSSPQEPLKKKRKLMSDASTGIIDAKLKVSNGLPLQALLSVAPDKAVLPGNDQGFQDSDIRPAEWGSDDCIATPFQHSVRFHPRKCDKCTKMDIPCVVLPDKKFGCTRLACANCNLMKVTCAIDGVGVRKRMQAKVSAGSSNSAEHSGTRIWKSHVISPVILDIAKEAEQQPGLPADVPIKTLVIDTTSQRPERGDQFAPTNRADPEPTARDILQGIQDLGRRFDLLATNEQLDTLDVRVRSVETNLHQRLKALEQCLNASDACYIIPYYAVHGPHLL
ncbi:uncharacterized protein F5147DRAFT_657698 [Suillus discolor]|uniref:Uncharacterized protein n=1 Tax=Suillus discolor TaxID=1912936 RepID=A0A9P7EWK0_9AGAM|nr:uncharacterized protein F5147DRAFT_657698 [Suillus discolor]KAG2092284.1 hypothetical protein F5147DRAFT_657698 [Suillus discolor]